MESHEIRQRNIDVLEAEYGSLKAIGDAMREKLGAKDPKAAEKNYENVLSQVRNGKPMGKRFARDMEAALGKEKGWMDVAQFRQAELDIDAKEAGQILMQMSKDGREDERSAFMQMLRATGSRSPKASAANPFPRVPKGGGDGGTQ